MHAEFFTRSRWLPSEPLVVTLRARHHDAFGRNVVQLDRLTLLGVVPYRDQIRNGPQHRLARQVIPAANAQHRPKPQRARTHVVIDLRRAKVDERRDQHYVRRLLAIEGVELMTARYRLLELAEQPAERLSSTRPTEHGQPCQPAHGLRRALLRAASQSGRCVIAGIEKPQIVNPESQFPPEFGPRASLSARRPPDGHVRIPGGQTLDQSGPSE